MVNPHLQKSVARYLSQIGKRGGASRSPAKQAASRLNGTKRRKLSPADNTNTPNVANGQDIPVDS